jgi:BirA family biotin operon repressor/biotin-[acetyl-CoA-carboxylase] ligase
MLLAQWHGKSAQRWRELWHTGELRFYQSVGSTNDVVAQMAAAGAPQLSMALAEEQTRGRGRGGASWRAQPGSALLFSVLFRAEQPGGSPGCAPVRVGLAVADAISQVAGRAASVKWPNDVVFDGCGKVAGVLCEGAFSAEGRAHIIAGIGINVFQSAYDFPPDLRDSACSIRSAAGVDVDRAELVGRIIDNLRAIGDHFTEPLTDAELLHYAERDVLRDVRIVCDTGGNEMIRGIARGVAPDGALLVQSSDAVVPVYNGVVRLAQSHAYPGSGRKS